MLNQLSPLAIIILTVVLLACAMIVLLITLLRIHIRKIRDRNLEKSKLIEKTLGMSDYFMVHYDMRTGFFKSIYGKQLVQDNIDFREFLYHCHPEERERVKENMLALMNGRKDSFEVAYRWNLGTHEEPDWQHLLGNAVAEKDRRGKVRAIVATMKNMTKEIRATRADEELVSKYVKIFDSILVAMSFFDADGNLMDMNVNMRELLGVTPETESMFYSMRLYDIPLFKDDIDPQHPDEMYVCQHAVYPELHYDKYIEYKLRPLFDDNGALIYYIVTARDVTDERQAYVDITEQNRRLKEVNETIVYYEKQLQYMLEKGHMFVFRHNIATDIIRFSHSLSDVEYELTYEDYMALHFEEDRKRVTEHIRGAIKDHRPTNSIRHFHHTPVDDKPAWYAISTMPVFDDKKQLQGYFGVMRNITDLMKAQEQLRIETERADRSGRLKSAFLANMTHEIRTPLNAIVGFSDLLHLIDAPEERSEFIRIILNNCDMLLRLINDILQSGDTGNPTDSQLNIIPTDVDFALVFDDICQTLQQRVDIPGVEFLKENPYSHFQTRLDKGRIQQVCTNFVTNAVKYTRQGHIKLGYRYENGELYIYCEDTGAGIPKEKQASVFDRFVKLNTEVQGTGLGLNICRNIAQNCGGSIGVTSEGEGCGSTFWIRIPCISYSSPQ